jgi:hypothetical protein
MQLGQAAGATAALAVQRGCSVRNVGVREVQSALLASGAYIMPYLDLPKDHPHFQALQRIGATGILRGEGRNVGWANQTWFRADDPLRADEIFIKDYYSGPVNLGEGEMTIRTMINILRGLGARIPASEREWWTSMGLDDFSSSRPVSRLEAAVVIDTLFRPFDLFEVDYDGRLVR